MAKRRRAARGADGVTPEFCALCGKEIIPWTATSTKADERRAVFDTLDTRGEVPAHGVCIDAAANP